MDVNRRGNFSVLSEKGQRSIEFRNNTEGLVLRVARSLSPNY